VTITGGRMLRDDELLLEGTYVHPLNGKIVETEVNI
jgi:hypothetical protein